jgi:hypothetical protein
MNDDGVTEKEPEVTEQPGPKRRRASKNAGSERPPEAAQARALSDHERRSRGGRHTTGA